MNIAIHPSTESYYMVDSPLVTSYSITPGESIQLAITVQEFNMVNREYSRCEKSPNYSQTTCIHTKKMEFLIKKAECYVPEVTGYPTFGNYEICNNITTVNNFNDWRWRLSYPNYYKEPVELKKEIKKCPDPCQRYIYKVVQSNYTACEWSPCVKVSIGGDGMLFMKVDEHFSVTLDMFISDIGGILGLFLGFSCLSFVPWLKALYKMIKRRI